MPAGQDSTSRKFTTLSKLSIGSPIPFACVSENIVNGNEVNFHEGVLATAMRASMAIPGVFTPVRLDSMVLVDGGVVNNYPVNVAAVGFALAMVRLVKMCARH